MEQNEWPRLNVNVDRSSLNGILQERAHLFRRSDVAGTEPNGEVKRKVYFYSVKDLIQRWQVSESTIFRQVRTGRIKKCLIGGQVRFSAAEVDRYEREAVVGPAPAKRTPKVSTPQRPGIQSTDGRAESESGTGAAGAKNGRSKLGFRPDGTFGRIYFKRNRNGDE